MTLKRLLITVGVLVALAGGRAATVNRAMRLTAPRAAFREQFDARRMLNLPISLRNRGGANCGSQETSAKSGRSRESSVAEASGALFSEA